MSCTNQKLCRVYNGLKLFFMHWKLHFVFHFAGLLNQESLLTGENIKIKVPFSSVTFTNTGNHFLPLFLPTWNILFALIVLFKWLAWQLSGDRGRECVFVRLLLSSLGLNGDEFTPSHHMYLDTYYEHTVWCMDTKTNCCFLSCASVVSTSVMTTSHVLILAKGPHRPDGAQEMLTIYD